MTKQIRLEIKPRNNLVLTRMEKLGIKNVAELCRLAGVKHQSRVGEIINLKLSPLIGEGEVIMWRPEVEAVAAVLGMLPGELFTEAILEIELDPKAKLQFDLDVVELKQLGGRIPTRILLEASPTPEDVLSKKEFKGGLKRALNSLTPREQKVLILLYGLNDGNEKTQKEVALMEGISPGRIHQIQAKALRKMRHPYFARHLRSWVR